MRGLTRRWLFRPVPDDVTAAAGGGDLPPLVRRILAARGRTDPDDIRRFFAPKLTDLPPPATLPGAIEAAGRLVAAVRGGESIAIYGDYDVDGITATAILYHIIRTADPEARVRTYVPHRLDEGYGLNAEALRQLREDGVDLVVTVDCGITADEPVRAGLEAGLDVIVTDHHHLPSTADLPAALLVHPRLPGGDYPNPDLAGVGVAYKLAWQFALAWSGSERVGKVFQDRLLSLLPFAAMGTIADVVPLTGENRVLAHFGLRLMLQTPYEGLAALLAASDLGAKPVGSDHVGYVLGPRLNACGRMGHAAEAVELLTEATGPRAKTIAERLAAMNTERRSTERDIVEEATRERSRWA